MKLSRDQIEKFLDVYNHFHEIEHFTVDINDDGKVIISFDLTDVKLSESKEQFVLDKQLNK